MTTTRASGHFLTELTLGGLLHPLRLNRKDNFR